MPGTLGIVHSGRMRAPLPLTSFSYSTTGNGDNLKATFTWSNSPNNNDLTGHTLKVYNSSDTEVDSVNSSGPTATSVDYTFASNSTTYYVRLFAKSAGGLSSLGATTAKSNRRLKVVTGAKSTSTTTTTDTSGWGTATWFTATYWTQSQWPGQPYNDYTYSGDKAFDGDYHNTFWRGQWYASNYPGGSDWIGFKLGSGSATRRINDLYLWIPSGGYEFANNVHLDEWNGSDFNWTYLGWNGETGYNGDVDAFWQRIPCNFNIAANTTRYFRFYMWDLGQGANGSQYGSRNAIVSEVNGNYSDWVTSSSTTTTNVAATATSIIDE